MITIRLIRADDWQGLYDLIDKVDRTMVGMHSSTNELVDEWISMLEPGVWEVYVAILSREEIEKERDKFSRKLLPWRRIRRNESGIVGVITLFGDWQEDEFIEKGDFEIGITVAPAFQKRGIGKELMKYIIKRGKELDYKRVSLWTRIDNEPMIKLAVKLGFKEGRTRHRSGYVWRNYLLSLEQTQKNQAVAPSNKKKQEKEETGRATKHSSE